MSCLNSEMRSDCLLQGPGTSYSIATCTTRSLIRRPYGNGGTVEASGPPLDGFAASATLTIPANGALVLARG
jgi:hypothetical protein